MKAVPRNAIVAKFSSTLNCIFVSRSLILTCTVILPLVFSWSYDADKTNVCTSLHILDNRSVSSISFEKRFDSPPVWRRQATGCVILFSAVIEMRTKYAKCPVAVITEAWFAYWGERNFAYVFSKRLSPALLSNSDAAKCMLFASVASQRHRLYYWVHECWACLLWGSNVRHCSYQECFCDFYEESYVLVIGSNLRHCRYQEYYYRLHEES